MGGFRWMSVGRSRSRSRCAWPQLSSMSLSLSLKLKKRGNVGARDSEWKKSAPIRGNKWLVIAAEAADDGGGRERATIHERIGAAFYRIGDGFLFINNVIPLNTHVLAHCVGSTPLFGVSLCTCEWTHFSHLELSHGRHETSRSAETGLHLNFYWTTRNFSIDDKFGSLLDN